jgi:hypothetical protein
MTSLYKIATLNIKGVVAPQRFLKLKEFFYEQDIDFLFLQEVTIPVFPPFAGYRTYVNVGTTHRGTAVIISDRMWLVKLDMLPSGLRMAASCGFLYLVIIHGTFGTSRWSEREEFFNEDLSSFCVHIAKFHHWRDLNCILDPLDEADAINSSRVLDSLFRRWGLVGSSKNTATRQA